MKKNIKSMISSIIESKHFNTINMSDPHYSNDKYPYYMEIVQASHNNVYSEPVYGNSEDEVEDISVICFSNKQQVLSVAKEISTDVVTSYPERAGVLVCVFDSTKKSKQDPNRDFEIALFRRGLNFTSELEQLNK